MTSAVMSDNDSSLRPQAPVARKQRGPARSFHNPLRGSLVAGRLAHNQGSGGSIPPRATSCARGCAMVGAPVGHFPPGPAGPGAHRSTTPEGRSATMLRFAPRPAAHCQTRSARPGLLGAAVPRRGRGQHTNLFSVLHHAAAPIPFAREGHRHKPFCTVGKRCWEPRPARSWAGAAIIFGRSERGVARTMRTSVAGRSGRPPSVIICWRRSWRQAPRGFRCSIR